jgi:glycosyltransferase involved in cell wall biosynthesis
MSDIVHYGKFFSPSKGGIESVTKSLALGAINKGYSVSVICFSKDVLTTKIVTFDSLVVVQNPISLTVFSQPLGVQYVKQCLIAGANCKIVHLHLPNMLGALIALLLSKNVRLVVHWHSDVINKGIVGRISRLIEIIILRRANKIIATSLVYANSSKVLHSFLYKVEVIPIGVPDLEKRDEFFDLPSELSRKCFEKKIILSIGRLVYYKGFHVLVDAAKYCNMEVIIVIVGTGPMYIELQRTINRLKLGDRVILLGDVSDDFLEALLHRSSLFCLPSISRAEAFGVVLLEAMRHGLPIVASAISGSGVSWVNEHGVSGINVPPEDPVALAEACNVILTSSKLRESLAMGARNRYLVEFTEEVSIKKTLKLYNSLVQLSTT